jgi:YVTN family beta-propeller protein
VLTPFLAEWAASDLGGSMSGVRFPGASRARAALAVALLAAAPVSAVAVAEPTAAAAGPAALLAAGPSAYPTVYAVNTEGLRLMPIDTRTGKAEKPILLSGAQDWIWGIAISPDGSTAYVADDGAGGTLIVPVNLATGKPGKPFSVAPNMQQLAVTPDGTTAYVTSETNDTVVPVNLATKAVGTPIPVGSAPCAIAIAPDGDTAYVTNAGGNTVTPIDLATGTPGKPIKVGNVPQGIAIAPDGKTAYVTNSGGPDDTGGNTVTPIELATGKPGKPIKVGDYPFGIAITPDGATAYVANATIFRGQVSSVTPINLATGRPGKPIKANAGNIVISPTGSTAYASSQGHIVTPISIKTNKPGRLIRVAAQPVTMAVAPGWYAQQPIPPARTGTAPALGVFRGAPYAAYRISRGGIGYAARKGSGWSPMRLVSGHWGSAATSQTPALASYHHELYAFWTAARTGKIMYSAFNGTSWSAPRSVSGPWGHAVTASTPAVAAAGPFLHVAWTNATSGSVLSSQWTGSSWSAQRTVAKDATSHGPAIAVLPFAPNGGSPVLVAWTEHDGRIGDSEVTAQTIRALGTIPQARTNRAPAMAYAGTSTDGTLYLAWTGRTGQIGYKAIFHALDSPLAPSDWTAQQFEPQSQTSASPALAAIYYTLNIAWIRKPTDRLSYAFAVNPY